MGTLYRENLSICVPIYLSTYLRWDIEFNQPKKFCLTLSSLFYLRSYTVNFLGVKKGLFLMCPPKLLEDDFVFIFPSSMEDP